MRSLGRQSNRDYHLAGLKYALTVRCVGGQPVKCFERHLAPSGSSLDFDNGVQGDKRYAEIGRMRRDAALAPS